MPRDVSCDGSYRRGKEIVFNFHNLFANVSIGREVDELHIDCILDDETEDRLDRLKECDVSLDYIFCSRCEKALSRYFESEYADVLNHGKKVEKGVEYFFWLTILWRIGKYMQSDIPKKVISMSHRSILSYMRYKESDGNVKLLYPLKYYVLYCPNYCKSHSATIYIRYYPENGVILMMLGDLIVVFISKGTRLPKNVEIFGLEHVIDKDLINNGNHYEKRKLVETLVFERVYSNVIKKEAERYAFRIREVIYELWPDIRKIRKSLPIMPDENYIQSVFQCLADKQIKIGDKFSKNHHRRSLAKAFDEIYSNA